VPGDVTRPAELVLKLFVVTYRLFERHQFLFCERYYDVTKNLSFFANKVKEKFGTPPKELQI
jgi:hypothetical protein